MGLSTRQTRENTPCISVHLRVQVREIGVLKYKRTSNARAFQKLWENLSFCCAAR